MHVNKAAGQLADYGEYRRMSLHQCVLRVCQLQIEKNRFVSLVVKINTAFIVLGLDVPAFQI